MEMVSESQKRAHSDFPLEKKHKNKTMCIELVSSTELVRTVPSTLGFSACPCLLEANDGFSWDLATSKGDADSI